MMAELVMMAAELVMMAAELAMMAHATLINRAGGSGWSDATANSSKEFSSHPENNRKNCLAGQVGTG